MIVLEEAALASTLPTLYTAFLVTVFWFGRAQDAFQSSNRTPTDWLIMGIWISFLGSFFDNLFWSIPWSMEVVNYERTNEWFRHGAIPNILSRHLCGTVAGYCHIRALIEERHLKSVGLNWSILLASVGGIFYVYALVTLVQ